MAKFIVGDYLLTGDEIFDPTSVREVIEINKEKNSMRVRYTPSSLVTTFSFSPSIFHVYLPRRKQLAFKVDFAKLLE